VWLAPAGLDAPGELFRIFIEDLSDGPDHSDRDDVMTREDDAHFAVGMSKHVVTTPRPRQPIPTSLQSPDDPASGERSYAELSSEEATW